MTVDAKSGKKVANAIDEPSDDGSGDPVGSPIPIVQEEADFNTEVVIDQEPANNLVDDHIDEIDDSPIDKDADAIDGVAEITSHSRSREKRSRGGKKIQEKQRQRVIVVDEKMDIQNGSLSMGDATQSLMNLDILYVKDVGYGMTRGMMDLGRLYQ